MGRVCFAANPRGSAIRDATRPARTSRDQLVDLGRGGITRRAGHGRWGMPGAGVALARDPLPWGAAAAPRSRAGADSSRPSGGLPMDSSRKTLLPPGRAGASRRSALQRLLAFQGTFPRQRARPCPSEKATISSHANAAYLRAARAPTSTCHMIFTSREPARIEQYFALTCWIQFAIYRRSRLSVFQFDGCEPSPKLTPLNARIPF